MGDHGWITLPALGGSAWALLVDHYRALRQGSGRVRGSRGQGAAHAGAPPLFAPSNHSAIGATIRARSLIRPSGTLRWGGGVRRRIGLRGRWQLPEVAKRRGEPVVASPQRLVELGLPGRRERAPERPDR
jgi:hypothetical protein